MLFNSIMMYRHFFTSIQGYVNMERGVERMINETMKIDNLENERAKEVKEIIEAVYDALKVKGYNPISQIVGYILSGDPTYITNYNNARSVISRIERDEILEELVKSYIKEM